MEESATNQGSFQTIHIQPRNVYGLRTDVIGNVQFTARQEIIYPVENVLAFHNYVSNKQKFLRLPEYTEPMILAISPNRKFLAVQERYKTDDVEENSVVIYDLTTLKKRRTLKFPESEELKWMVHDFSFTSDSKSLVVLTEPPEEMLFYFLFDKSDTIIQGRAGNINKRGVAECFACHPNDPNNIAVGGDNVYKLMSKSDKGFAYGSNLKMDGIHITSINWLTNEMVIAGTINAQLLCIEGSEIKATLDAYECEVIDLLKMAEADESIDVERPTDIAEIAAKAGVPSYPGGTSTLNIQLSSVGSPETSAEISIANVRANLQTTAASDERVLCMETFSRGFAFSIFNAVYVFEKMSKFRFERKTILRLPIGIFPEHLYDIRNIAINLQEDTVIASAKHSQIYVGVLILPETLKTKELEFKVLGEPLHIDEIIAVSVCAWRPIIMTASKDKTVRIWNYETEKQELLKKYEIDLTAIELNPTGLMAAVGFADQLRVVEIFLNDLNILKTYNFPRCRYITYSNYGHYLAVAYDNLIGVTSVYNFAIIRVLKGHNGDVVTVGWSSNDKYLISVGSEGAVYNWDIDTGERVHEVVQKGVNYTGLALTNNDPLSIYATTSDAFVRKINDSEIVREVKVPTDSSISSVTLSKSDVIMFVSTEKGELFNVEVPFLERGGGECVNFRFFRSKITNLKISYDGTLLFTASADGTLAIWVMKNIEGKIAAIDQDLLNCKEVLISRRELLDKIDTIATLELRMQQQVEEFQYQLNQNVVFGEQQMSDIHRFYIEALKELKEKNDELEKTHIESLNSIGAEIKELKTEHQKEIQNVATQFSERMLVEYHKLTKLRENMFEMRENYEEKLRKSAGCLQNTVEALETDFKKQLEERQELIRQLMFEMEEKKVEFIEYSRQVEVDNDRNTISLQIRYEKKLKLQEELTLKYRGEAGVLKKKYDAMVKDTENLNEEIDLLKEEHRRNKREIEKHLANIQDLKKEISDRDYALIDKEKRIQEVQNKNSELEKYKYVLSHKVNELKEQIEPRDRLIQEKRAQIADLERELENIHQNNVQLELQLNELKDKYISSATELRTEKQRARAARKFIIRICSDIFLLADNLNKTALLKNSVKRIFKKYCNDLELQRNLAEENAIRDEFLRQRNYLEKKMQTYRKQLEKKEESVTINRLIKENVQLLEDLNMVRRELKRAHRNMMDMESVLGISRKFVTATQGKEMLMKALTNYNDMEEKHKNEIRKLQESIRFLQEENLQLRQQLFSNKKDGDATAVPAKIS